MRNRAVRLLRYILLLGIGWTATPAFGQYTYTNTPLRTILSDIEADLPWRFLYRDALVAGTTLTFQARFGDPLPELNEALTPYGLQLKVDAERKQVLITQHPLDEPSTETLLTGYCLDDADGQRLPLATLTWLDGNRRRGVSANASGAFQATLPAQNEPLTLTASFVGYHPQEVRVNPNDLPTELAIRLRPYRAFGSEVVVQSNLLQSDLDTTWQHMIQPAQAAPFGENNLLRALQPLPAVTVTPALASGLNVRGSRDDGFQVLLDGISIYNQDHLFGLFDAFYDDALQTVGFYYGIAPAQLQATPGGTLSFTTRTGAQTQARQRIGLSNTAVRGTLEGPLWNGRGSWLLSGRHSYIDAVDWFNNAELIARGLDINRETSAPPIAERLEADFVEGDGSARFYDLHGKLYLESTGGTRLMGNLYLGGDRTRHDDQRLNILPGNPNRTTLQNVVTQNRWGNKAGSLHFHRALGSNLYGYTLLGLSRYRSTYAKDDFLYQERPNQNGQPNGQSPNEPFLAAFAQDNDLREWKWAQHVEGALPRLGLWSVGYAVHHYTMDYTQQSAIRSDFRLHRTGMQADAFAQYEHRATDALHLDAGVRSHYFSQGRLFRLSPRLSARILPDRKLSFGAGFSRNHQFLHRLSLTETSSAAVWIMSGERLQPTAVNYGTAGLYARPSPGLSVQVEAYTKDYDHLWEHEINTRRRPRLNQELPFPWETNYTARSRGVEVMAQFRRNGFRWTNSYARSKTELQHPSVNRNTPFPADWDRPHQFTTAVQGPLGTHLTWHLTWLYASGAPNTLAHTTPNEPDRLDAYHRMDLSVAYQQRWHPLGLEARFSIFNVYDRDNPWYRSALQVLRALPNAPLERRFINVDVYDLGIQPSFNLTLTF